MTMLADGTAEACPHRRRRRHAQLELEVNCNSIQLCASPDITVSGS